MPPILHLAPVGAEKTAHLHSLLRETTQSGASIMPKVWVLLAARRQALSFRQGLIDLDSRVPVYFNIEFFNFYSLNARLLKLAGAPVRRLDNQTRYTLLRRILAGLLGEGELGYFHCIAETRGFVAALADLIDELKQARVDVADFAAAALGDKDKETALIYRRYQDTLRRSGLADVEGEGWLALAKLQARPDIASDVDLLLVDGYDQFTPVQAQMLAALSRAIPKLHITLTDIPAADSAQLPQRSALARERLHSAFAAAGLDLTQERIEPAAGARHADLERLGQGIFRGAATAANGAAIRLIEMPNPAEEVRSILRKIKRQLLDGALPDDILVALRNWTLYASHFEAVGAEYCLPLLFHYERPLHTTPVIAVIIDLLGLAPRFRRRDLLDVLRSPYIDSGLDSEQIDLLDRISMEQRLIGGDASEWLEAIRLAGVKPKRDDEDSLRTVLKRDQRDILLARLSAFFTGVTPPERAKVGDFVNWLDTLLGGAPNAEPAEAERQPKASGFHLGLVEGVLQSDQADAAIVSRDVMALNALKGILRDLSASDDVIRATFGETVKVDWRRFRADFAHALETTAADPFDRSRTGKVLVTTAAEARGLPHNHVYIPGLAEGVFPAEISEDPLYLDSERQAMQARGIPLATQAGRIDDRGLFYELIGLPRETLTLSRPAFQAGKPWLESYLWRAVRRVLPNQPIESRMVGAVIPPAEAASGPEVMLSTAAHLLADDQDRRDSAQRSNSWIQTQPAFAEQWRPIARGCRIERGRHSLAPFDRYSGVLSQPDLLGVIARELGREQVWSATKLNDYGYCGFRYFAKRILKLEQVAEPEPGIDALQLGLLSHSILEATYRRIRSQLLNIEESNQDAALSIFDEQAAALLADAPSDYGFRAGATWAETAKLLRSRLAALVKLDFSAESPLSRFGKLRQVRMLERYFDEAEIEMPGDMPALRVSGFIDRVDWADDDLVLVDYKAGSRAISRRQMEIGRDFQMFVYALAMEWAERHSPGEPRLSGGLFWHLRNLKPSGVFAADDEDDQAAIETARLHVARNVRQGRHGQFPVHAAELEDGKCVRYCEFTHLCRRQVTSRFKALPEA